ncbi:MAG: 1-acyl-sn-glycerol-3-phosphate acyltransferase [Spirochaetia bacterium]|nr:1-acyl-sn-glycerol-3-phosphate acyltransferase [Spirochaetia bacterium]
MKRVFGFIFWFIWIVLFIPLTILCALTILILNFLWIGKSNLKTRFFRIIYRFWGKTGIFLSFSPVKIIGDKKSIPKPALIISNHQSDFDIFAGGFYPADFLFLSKKEVFDIPLVGKAMTKCEFISVDRENPRNAAKALIAIVRRMKKKQTILMYPEGTRSNDASKLLPFKNGSLSAARSANVPITPIVVRGTQQVKPNNKKFYIFPHRILINILETIEINNELHPANAESKITDAEKLNKIRMIMQTAYDKMS